jgi:plastocyanin
MRLFASLVVAATLLAFPALAASHTVNIQNMKFSPASLTVAAGDTVKFVNKDGMPHTASAKDGSFDTGRIGSGDSKSITVQAAGTFAYVCKIHPSMKGSIKAD